MLNVSKNESTHELASQVGIDKNDPASTFNLKSQMRSQHSKRSSAVPKKVDTYMDPEFWYHKGVVLNQNDSAL